MTSAASSSADPPAPSSADPPVPSSSSSDTGDDGAKSVVETFQEMRSTYNQRGNKIIELYADLREHERTIAALKKVEPTRKSWRLLGSVLVERTAGEILPNLETQHKQILTTVQKYERENKVLEKEIQEYQKANKIRIVRQ